MIVKISCHIGDWQARSEIELPDDDLLNLDIEDIKSVLRKLDNLVKEHKGLPTRSEKLTAEYRAALTAGLQASHRRQTAQ